MRKDGLANDAEVQALEDALCLVFLETQLADVVARLDPDTLQRVLVRTAKKMSDAGRAAIADVPLDAHARHAARRPRSRATSSSATSPASPRTTGTRSPRRSRPTSSAWARTATSTAAASRTRRSWPRRSARSAATSSTSIACSWPGPTVTVELRETVDDGDARLETAEAVVFDTADGLITSVAVYLQTSERHPPRPSE